MSTLDLTTSSVARSLKLMLALVALVLAAVLLAAPAHANEASGQPIPGQFIVADDGDADPRAIANETNADPKAIYREAIDGFAAKLTDSQVEALRSNPDVKTVRQDRVIVGASTQVAPSWGLDRIDERSLPMDGYYIYNNAGAGVRAYVIDSGIQTSHAQFGSRASAMYDAWGGTGQDCHGHGTHVAGTIGGSTYGVAKQVMLRSVRVLDCSNKGTMSGLLAGVDWVRRNAVKPAVVNISIEGPQDSLVNTAVKNLADSGVFVAAAAGNSNTDACSKSPASSAGAFTVANATRTDTRAGDSNYGPCVDIYAPGTSILSAALGGGARYDSGTSMASPHVTATVAIGKQYYGDSYTSASWGTWLRNSATSNVIGSNVTGTPNRLLYQPL